VYWAIRTRYTDADVTCAIGRMDGRVVYTHDDLTRLSICDAPRSISLY